MEHHAAECDRCKSEMEFLRAIVSTMHTLPNVEMPTDFLDTLNARIDEEIDGENKEEYIKPIVRVAHNFHHNWKRYVAVAACFALVAVITFNGRQLVDVTDDKDGVISEITLVTDTLSSVSDDESEKVETSKVEETQVLDESKSENNENTSEKSDNALVKQTLTPSKVSDNIAKRNISADNSVVENVPKENDTVASTVSPSVAEPVATQETSVSDESARADVAEMSLDEPTVANARTVSEPAYVNEENSDDVADGYSLARKGGRIAYGRYYKLDKDGNPIEEKEENKAIGSIVISAEDADEALDVIRQYSYDEDGEFYTITSDRLTSMLTILSGQGIDYSNYTPAYDGEVTFKLVIS